MSIQTSFTSDEEVKSDGLTSTVEKRETPDKMEQKLETSVDDIVPDSVLPEEAVKLDSENSSVVSTTGESGESGQRAADSDKQQLLVDDSGIGGELVTLVDGKGISSEDKTETEIVGVVIKVSEEGKGSTVEVAMTENTEEKIEAKDSRKEDEIVSENEENNCMSFAALHQP